MSNACELCDAAPATKEVKLDWFTMIAVDGPVESPARPWQLCGQCHDDAWALRWRPIADRFRDRTVRETGEVPSDTEVGMFMTLWRAAFARANGLAGT